MRFRFLRVAITALGSAHAASLDLAAMPHAVRQGVVETPGIIYATYNGYRPLDLTIYRPEHAAAALPIVVVVHGGGWFQDPFKPVAGTPPDPNAPAAETDATLWRLAARGYVVASVSYRLSSEAKFPAQIDDVRQAVRFLRAHAADMDGDPAHILAWGSSAGGYLVTLLGASCHGADCVQAVVAWYAPIDFSLLDAEAARDHLPPGGNSVRHDAPNSPESRLLGCALPVCSADLLKQANPLMYLTAAAPPFLIVQGLADRAVPWQQAQILADALKRAGVPATLHLVSGADHMFQGISKTESDQLTQETFDWIDRVSGKR
jgi:acetyl esterase/lipase